MTTHNHPILGVDPGVSGAICLLFGGIAEFWDTPTFRIKQGKRTANVIDGHALVAIFDEAKQLCLNDEPLAIIESVHAMPGQGVATTFAFGRAYGTLEGVLAAARIPTMYVTPHAWKKAHGLTGQEKDASRQLAIRKFPAAADDLKLKKHHGRADALLLADWGHRNG